MPQPDAEPTTDVAVKAYLSVTDGRLDTVIADAVAASSAFVRSLPIAHALDDGSADDDWPARISLGAKMLAARLVRRRDTPSGVQNLAEEGAVYVSRNDPDVAQLLQIGAYTKPSVG